MPFPALAVVEAQAVRVVPEQTDVVSVYNSGALTFSTESRAIAAAVQADADYAVSHAASMGMTLVSRRGTTVQAAPAGYAYPMGTTVLDPTAVEALMSETVAEVLTATDIVMSSLTASLRGAVAGDEVTLVSASGAPVVFTIAAVVSDAITGGTELLLSPEAADRVGLDRKSSVIMWNFPDRATIDRSLADNALVSNSIRIRRGWDPADPDSTLGMAAAKSLLGEFAYRVNADGSVSIDSAWTSENLPSGRRLLDSNVQIIARCHNLIEPALRAALAEVAANGLSYTINVYDANRAGGCYNPRFNRLAVNSSIGFLSRHTWAMAIDTNTIGSCQGCAPPDLDCRTVRIFRKHGFAWGGNFLTPDGMHFEFVGERRDQLPYPSRFCENIVADNAFTDPDAPLPVEATERATLFADAGLVAEHHE
ncbi:M15 family metallopeptidase [Ilumatobacter coccineus]|uniref:M15 family metallopeptidase n=1 Tax=Ilumatobacter coccineus TaxID=467094 RepID=UPI0012B69551|nr:M15 family metallopeptidase [Ilumatobacter coccineus]